MLRKLSSFDRFDGPASADGLAGRLVLVVLAGVIGRLVEVLAAGVFFRAVRVVGRGDDLRQRQLLGENVGVGIGDMIGKEHFDVTLESDSNNSLFPAQFNAVTGERALDLGEVVVECLSELFGVFAAIEVLRCFRLRVQVGCLFLDVGLR